MMELPNGWNATQSVRSDSHCKNVIEPSFILFWGGAISNFNGAFNIEKRFYVRQSKHCVTDSNNQNCHAVIYTPPTSHLILKRCFSASCRTFDKLNPARSAAKAKDSGNDTAFLTVLLELSNR